MPIKIQLLANGPIILKTEGDDFPVLQTEGGDIATKGVTALCRCGASKSKPTCDGAHSAAGFSDENRCQNDGLEDFTAPGITVHFNRSICSGAAACVHTLPAVFKSTSGDWIHPAEAPVEDVIAAVGKCPSGALTYTVDGRTEVKQEDEVSIRIVKNGPYEFKGPVEIQAPKWSHNASKTNFALCRCGKSDNAPFCDYNHGEQGWEDSE